MFCIHLKSEKKILEKGGNPPIGGTLSCLFRER
ncbi:hypothetical protein RF55_25356, partial [Lasius niger]